MTGLGLICLLAFLYLGNFFSISFFNFALGGHDLNDKEERVINFFNLFVPGFGWLVLCSLLVIVVTTLAGALAIRFICFVADLFCPGIGDEIDWWATDRLEHLDCWLSSCQLAW